MWMSLAFAVLQRFEPAPASPFDRVLPLEITSSDPLLEGRGHSKRIPFEADFSGTLHVWATAPGGVDLFLRVEGDLGQLVVEDDDSGGGHTPYAMLALEPGQTFSVQVALARPGETAAIELHAAASVETDVTRAAGRAVADAIVELRRLREGRDFSAAQDLVASTLDHLVSTSGAATSHVAAMAARDLGRQAYELSAAADAVRAWSVTYAHRLRVHPRDHIDLQRTRGNLALAKYVLGDLEHARELQEEMLGSCERLLPADHPELQAARMNLAITVEALGDLERSRELGTLALEARARTLPEDDPNLSWARGNLGLTLRKLGDLAGARALLERVVDAFERGRPPDDAELQKARGNLASVLHALGDLQGARALEEEVLEVLSRSLPDEHRDLQMARMNLASTLLLLGQVQDARALLERVVETWARELPEHHSDLLLAQSNLAAALSLTGELSGARELLERVLDVQVRTLTADHPNTQSTQQTLVDTLRRLGDLERSIALGESVVQSLRRALPEEQQRLQEARLGLAWSLAHVAARADPGGPARRSAMRRCAELVEATCAAQSRSAHTAILTSSGREATARCESMRASIGFALSAAAGFGVCEPDGALDQAAFALAETTRGASVVAAEWMRRTAGDPRHAKLRAALRARSHELAQIAQRGTASDEFHRAVAAREAAERDLVALAREMPAGEALASSVDARQLAATLSERDALVCYRRYERTVIDPTSEPAGASDTTNPDRTEPVLCAHVVRRSSATTLDRVELGSIDRIGEAVAAWRSSLGVGAELRGVSASHGVATSSSDDASRALRERVFDPLRSSLAGADRLILVLDDVLHLVPMDALVDEGASDANGEPARLGDRWSIETRATAAELISRPSRPAGSNDLLVIGGVEYGHAPIVVAAVVGKSAASDARGILRGGAWERGFTELPATLEEARSIADLHASRWGDAAPRSLLSGADATRDRLVNLAPKMRWLHVATHGWFAPASIPSWDDAEPLDLKSGLGRRSAGDEEVRGMSPMLLCGIALAGASLPADALARVPGLITAEEISALDLSSCELAVLSACDTSVGASRAGQGVASLQRALQMAGARSVLASLWKVPDEATKELMLEFYRRLWIEKKPKHRALWEAKTALREARDERGAPKYTTRDWAAWVLTGAPD